MHVQLSQMLRLESLWLPSISLAGLDKFADAGVRCRIYLTCSLGILEPFCLFTGILLSRGILR